jgi:hypothetical protein
MLNCSVLELSEPCMKFLAKHAVWCPVFGTGLQLRTSCGDINFLPITSTDHIALGSGHFQWSCNRLQFDFPTGKKWRWAGYWIRLIVSHFSQWGMRNQFSVNQMTTRVHGIARQTYRGSIKIYRLFHDQQMYSRGSWGSPWSNRRHLCRLCSWSRAV